eukprot:TRINITY_DN26327_c0_g8_i1.p1 TRINITY_DN26327_c0_g8~~TRINITY_DN26327_c0_g8_i1.p1  ORF type:complete len:545 (+),score=38.61 TRINITY_DN26327_c0_g8_i1:54-1637(+)
MVPRYPLLSILAALSHYESSSSAIRRDIANSSAAEAALHRDLAKASEPVVLHPRPAVAASSLLHLRDGLKRHRAQKGERSAEPESSATVNWSWAVLGVLVTWFAVPYIWISELRNAGLETLIRRGEQEYLLVSSHTGDPNNRGRLVLVNDGVARGTSPLEDIRFRHNLTCSRGALMLKTDVEVYQWIEHRRGKGANVACRYEKAWSSERYASGEFKDPNHRNVFPVPGLVTGQTIQKCERVVLGDFALPTEMSLLDQSDMWTSKGEPFNLGETLSFGNKLFRREGDYYYYRTTSESVSETPEIGDTRVRIQYIPDQPLTVLALQVENLDDDCDTFMPFRRIPEPIFGQISPEERANLYILEAQKSAADFYKADMWNLGPFAYLFCCCNCVGSLVSACVTSSAPPEICQVIPGRRSSEDAWREVRKRCVSFKWRGRFIGWLVLHLGTHALLMPWQSKFGGMPLIGSQLVKLGAGASAILSLAVTLFVASLLCSTAYLVYHLRTGLVYLCLWSICWAALICGFRYIDIA